MEIKDKNSDAFVARNAKVPMPKVMEVEQADFYDFDDGYRGEPNRAYDYVSQEEDVPSSSQSFTRDPYSSRVWQSRGGGAMPADNVGRSMWQGY